MQQLQMFIFFVGGEGGLRIFPVFSLLAPLKGALWAQSVPKVELQAWQDAENQIVEECATLH